MNPSVVLYRLFGTVFPSARRSRNVLHILATWQERNEQRRLLAGMDDRLLKDVGLTRADVAHETGKPFWRD